MGLGRVKTRLRSEDVESHFYHRHALSPTFRKRGAGNAHAQSDSTCSFVRCVFTQLGSEAAVCCARTATAFFVPKRTYRQRRKAIAQPPQANVGYPSPTDSADQSTPKSASAKVVSSKDSHCTHRYTGRQSTGRAATARCAVPTTPKAPSYEGLYPTACS